MGKQKKELHCFPLLKNKIEVFSERIPYFYVASDVTKIDFLQARKDICFFKVCAAFLWCFLSSFRPMIQSCNFAGNLHELYSEG